MRSIVYSIFLSLVMYVQASAQSVFTGNSIPAYVDQLPKLVANATEAYNLYYPKGKKTAAYQQYEEEIRAMLNDLSARSNHQSSLLSMLAGNHDREGKIVDFTKVKIARDKEIDQRFLEFNSQFFGAIRVYSGEVSEQINIMAKQNIMGIPLAEKILSLYREKIPGLLKEVKKELTELDAFLTKKGYNTVLDKNNSTHPYYIQLLELRGLMLDRVLQLYQQIDGANQAAAMTVDVCRKNPEACK